MKTRITSLSLLFSVYYLQNVKSIELDTYKDDLFNIYNHVAIGIKNITHKDVTSDNVTYYLFTRDSPRDFVKINRTDPGKLTSFKVHLAIFVHGFGENRTNRWYEELKNAFLARKSNLFFGPEYNVLQVDWSGPYNRDYAISADNTRGVGKIMGADLANMHKKKSISRKKILLIGHSLGAHVCGFAGKTFHELTGKKLPRIIALDAAGPLFTNSSEKDRLDKNDASVVHAIHTNGGTFGMEQRYGTIDFFPNGGKSQPGCKLIKLLTADSASDAIACNHKRSTDFFIEATWNQGQFWSKKCDGWDKYAANLCHKDETDMGDLGTRYKGDFYLKTNEDKPFATGKPSSNLLQSFNEFIQFLTKLSDGLYWLNPF